jgi:perosamine synthetase
MTNEQTVPLSRPDITDLEREAVVSVLRTDRLSLGPKLAEFEQAVANFVGSKHAVAVSSGTSALHLAMLACGVGPGDDVITTPFSFVASANSVLFVGAKPVFVDIEDTTLNITAGAIEGAITERTKVILPVHVFGRPCDMVPIQALARRYKLEIVEDACEAIGARVGGRFVGTWGRCGTFAFYPNKQITTGEGGALVTDDDAVEALCRSLRNQGRSSMGRWLYHERLGYNYRLSDIACALGIAQMKRISEILERRAQVARWYVEYLRDIPDVTPPACAEGDQVISWFVFVIRVSEDRAGERDRIRECLEGQGIASAAYFPPIHLQPFYRERFGYSEGDFPVTEKAARSTIAVPFFTRMTEEQVRRVCDGLRAALRLAT